MPIYEYQSESGDIIGVHGSMKDEMPPTFVENGETYYRKFSTLATIVRGDGAVHHPGQELPISYSLPLDMRPGTIVRRGKHLIREHADGTKTTLKGERIIDSRDARERHAGECGYEDVE
jgi:hypothetical protein